MWHSTSSLFFIQRGNHALRAGVRGWDITSRHALLDGHHRLKHCLLIIPGWLALCPIAGIILSHVCSWHEGFTALGKTCISRWPSPAKIKSLGHPRVDGIVLLAGVNDASTHQQRFV
jgi:hypothetical protein